MATSTGGSTLLGRLMASPELREQMGRRGREFAELSWNASLFEQAVVSAITCVVERLRP